MATRVELPKDIVKVALEQAQSLRTRQIKASSNNIIKQALEEELRVISQATTTLTEIK